MIDVVELDKALDFLAEVTTRQLGQLVDVLLPAAEAGQAGRYTFLALELITDEVKERLQVAA